MVWAGAAEAGAAGSEWGTAAGVAGWGVPGAVAPMGSAAGCALGFLENQLRFGFVAAGACSAAPHCHIFHTLT